MLYTAVLHNYKYSRWCGFTPESDLWQAVVAMVLNALGFVDRPLYLFPEFMATKPVEILIREGLKAEDFNDDVLGRTLDKLYRATSSPILSIIRRQFSGTFSGFFAYETSRSCMHF